MGFIKYQKSERVEVVAANEAPETLRKFGVSKCPDCCSNPSCCDCKCDLDDHPLSTSE